MVPLLMVVNPNSVVIPNGVAPQQNDEASDQPSIPQFSGATLVKSPESRTYVQWHKKAHL